MVTTINKANLLKIIIVAKKRKIPDPIVVKAPEIIEIPKSFKDIYIFLCLSGNILST